MQILRKVRAVEAGTTSRQEPARTMADVRDRLLSGPDAQRPRVKLELSAISTLARVSGCAPDDISADPAKLRHHLSGISTLWLA